MILLNLDNNKVEVKFVWQISYPPANGASLGSYLVKNWQQTHGQTDKFSDTIYGCVDFSFSYLLPHYFFTRRG